MSLSEIASGISSMDIMEIKHMLALNDKALPVTPGMLVLVRGQGVEGVPSKEELDAKIAENPQEAWKCLKAVLGSTDIKAAMANFDVSKLSDDDVNEACAICMEDRDGTLNSMNAVSIVLASFYKWQCAVVDEKKSG